MDKLKVTLQIIHSAKVSQGKASLLEFECSVF